MWLGHLSLLVIHCYAAGSADEYRSEWQATTVLATNQGILVQEIVKDLVLVMLDVEADKHQAALINGVNNFTANLAALQNGDASRQIVAPSGQIARKDLAKIQAQWTDFAQLILSNIGPVRAQAGTVNLTLVKETIKYMDKIQTYSDEATTVIIAEGVLAGEDASEQDLIGIGERQLLLLHEMTKEVGLVSMNYSASYYLEKLISSSALFESSHQGLLTGSTWAGIPPMIKICTLNEMKDVTAEWQSLKPKILAITSASSLEQSIETAQDVHTIMKCADRTSEAMKLVVYRLTHDTACNDFPDALSPEEWTTVISTIERQNYLIAQVMQLYMQIALNFQVATSQVELTVLTESVAREFRLLLEGDAINGLTVPPQQEIAGLMLVAIEAWTQLEPELKKAVRSNEISATEVKEVARLSRICLERIYDSVSLYVKAGLESGTSAPVYSIDLATSQRSTIAKIAKETMLLSYGYDPVNSRLRMDANRQLFSSQHWKLVMGAAPVGYYPEVNKTTNVCIIRQMALILSTYEEMEIASLAVAEGNPELLEELVRLEPLAVKQAELAMLQYGGSNTTCEDAIYSDEEWQGLLREMGSLRALAQQVAVEYILLSEFNTTSAESYVRLLEESERRIKFGNRMPLVPAPYSQPSLDQILNELDPTVQNLLNAVAAADYVEVYNASRFMVAEISGFKKQFLDLAVAQKPEMPIRRIDLASNQIMLANQALKEKLFMMANMSITVSMGDTMAEFERVQKVLKDGGDGVPAVILNRFDIFKQWDQVMASWQTFKETLEAEQEDIPSMQAALSVLVQDLEQAWELYKIADQPLQPDSLWTIIAYVAISVFVCSVFCAGACLFCAVRRKPKQEEDRV